MTDFAQRLVARSAGRPAGLPLLMPRPASRFERSEAQAFEEVAETAAPAAARTVGDPGSDRIHVPAAQHPQEHRVAPPEAETMDAADGVPAREPQQDQEKTPVTVTVMREAMDRPLPIAASPSLERAGIDEPYREQESAAASRRISVTRVIETAPERGAAAEAVYLPPIIRQPDVAKAEQPPAPAISIGRIEVQFMAPEKPAAAPRPEPQRTRGFDAYARARRGVPR